MGIVCDVFDEATLMFMRVCDFNAYALKLSAVDIVNLLNRIYTEVDELVKLHGVYKVYHCFWVVEQPSFVFPAVQVEIIGESYVVSCGVPIPTEYHAEYIGDVALDILAQVAKIDYAPIGGKKVQVKIGKWTRTRNVI
jgi:class 3 adenylate cyclase